MSSQSLTALGRSATGKNSQTRLATVQRSKIGTMLDMHHLDNAKEILIKANNAIGAIRSFKYDPTNSSAQVLCSTGMRISLLLR